MAKIHPQAQDGETIDQLIKRAKKPKHGDGPPMPGELKAISCQSALHGERKNINDEHDYRDWVGVYDGVIPPPMYCNRCAYHDAVAQRSLEEKTEAAKKAAIAKLGLSEDDLKALGIK